MKKMAYVLMCTGLLSLTGCGSPDTSEEALNSVASCIVGNMSKEDLRDAGWGLGTQQNMKVFKKAHLDGCRDASKWKWDEKRATELLTPKVGQKVMYSPDFRYGIYASMAGSAAPKAQRKAFGDIGTKLEGFMAQRSALLNCASSKDSETLIKATFLTKIDTPFAIAAIGSLGGVADVGVAQKIASEMTARAKEFVPMNPQFSAQCDANVATAIQAQATEYLLFYKGTHPFAPGCYLKQSGLDMVLKCDGARKSDAPLPKELESSAAK